jgi:calcineurin-like phosphoesterase family protein
MAGARPNETAMSITSNASTTINLADYFFDGPSFTWKNVELTVEKWNTKLPGEEHLELTANHDPATEPDTVQFWNTYQNIELVLEEGVPDSVQWCPMNGANFEYAHTSTILPRDGAELIYHLDYDANPDAKDIPAFWERLVNFREHNLEPR